MADILSVDFTLASSWQAPVGVRDEFGDSLKISGPDEALAFLMHKWRWDRESRYDRAKRNCLGALCGRTSNELARVSFINAAAAARIFG